MRNDSASHITSRITSRVTSRITMIQAKKTQICALGACVATASWNLEASGSESGSALATPCNTLRATTEAN